MTQLVLDFHESRKGGKTISSDGALQTENVHGASTLRYLLYRKASGFGLTEKKESDAPSTSIC